MQAGLAPMWHLATAGLAANCVSGALTYSLCGMKSLRFQCAIWASKVGEFSCMCPRCVQLAGYFGTKFLRSSQVNHPNF